MNTATIADEAHKLSQERSLRERAEASERESRRELALAHAVLQEAHHRIKNTLQIAASVLSVHARETSSEEVRLALRESHGRLQLLAKAHELLYASADDMKSVLMPSLLNAVSDALRQSFAEMSARVKLQVTAEPLTLPVHEAIAVALLANEVVTNAYKHAFPNDSCGEITIDLRRTSENALSLRMVDNGVGLRSNPAGGGIGLKLVRNMAAQLQGVLTVSTADYAAGTAITFTTRPAIQSHTKAHLRATRR